MTQELDGECVHQGSDEWGVCTSAGEEVEIKKEEEANPCFVRV